jgi:hypothetical protein
MLSTCNKDNWVGWYQFLSIYQLTLAGTKDGRHQGITLIDLDTNEEYLHFVPRNYVGAVTDALFEYYIKRFFHDK